jgi:hypothetical protein
VLVQSSDPAAGIQSRPLHQAGAVWLDSMLRRVHCTGKIRSYIDVQGMNVNPQKQQNRQLLEALVAAPSSPRGRLLPSKPSMKSHDYLHVPSAGRSREARGHCPV